MGGPVIYHGASNGNGPWPAAGGAPSASELARFIWIPATTWQVALSDTGENPPYFTNSNTEIPGLPDSWFDRTISFPGTSVGGCWAQFSFYLPGNLNVAPGSLVFRLMWYGGVGSLNPVSWYVSVSVENPLFNIVGFGPGVLVQQVPIANQVMYAGPFIVSPRRGGLAVPLVGDRMYHGGVYRADTISMFPAEVFGIVVQYSIVP